MVHAMFRKIALLLAALTLMIAGGTSTLAEPGQTAAGEPRVTAAKTTTSTKAWQPESTAWSDTDLGSGVWSYATLTPLERPAGVEKAFLSTEEVARLEEAHQERNRGLNTNTTADPTFFDPESAVVKSGRASLIIDPSNGRLPPLTPEAIR